jgi:hypothetical protein
MAKVVLFEDEAAHSTLFKISLGMDSHEVVAHETTIQGAFRTLRALLGGEITTDYVLVDGTLDDERQGSDRDEPLYFDYALADGENIHVEVEKAAPQRHGRAILRIMHAANMSEKSVGISGESYPSDIKLDYDMGKSHLGFAAVARLFEPETIQ